MRRFKAEREEVRELGGLRTCSVRKAPRVASYRQPAARSLWPSGDPGESRFYLSMEDDLMRLFNSGMAQRIICRVPTRGLRPWRPHRVAFIHRLSTRWSAHAIIRKNVLKYDDVMTGRATTTASAAGSWRARTWGPCCALHGVPRLRPGGRGRG